MREQPTKGVTGGIRASPLCANRNKSPLLFSSAEKEVSMANSVGPDQTAVLGPCCLLLYLIHQ